jgi:very-short-patch-repair endonuclease
MGERRQRTVRAVSFRARDLRASSTPAEQILWELLRDRRLQGIKFRRQSPLGIFVADFYCPELKLVVELDGEIHSDPRQKARDENRDFYLGSLGCTILRFPNAKLTENAKAVLAQIIEVAKALREKTLANAPVSALPPGE